MIITKDEVFVNSFKMITDVRCKSYYGCDIIKIGCK